MTALSLFASVLLTATAQMLMRHGMVSGDIRAAIVAGNPVGIILQVILSPWVISGLALFAVSVVVWLNVLSKVTVSQAYPCVALGIVLTMLGGHFIFGEPIGLARVAGLALIVAGVGAIAVG